MWVSPGPSKGYVILKGFTFAITDISLREGKICIDAERPGPMPSLDGPVTIFGEDGQGFGQADSDMVLPAVREDEVASMHLTISFETLESAPQK